MTAPSTMITVGERTITSTATSHHARRVAIRPGRPTAREYWRVSWYPEATLDRNQAVTAMLLAQLLATEILMPDSPRWRHVDQWAAELGLDGATAALRILDEPHALDRRFHMLSTGCWCQPATALDGHVNGDSSEPEFAASVGGPIDDNGQLIETVR